MKPMKTYTVNEIRQTLGTILEPIFTESFNAKYHDYVLKYKDSPDDFISAATDDSAGINILIGELVYNRHNPQLIEALIQSHSSKTLSGIFLRYHVLTQYLISLDQDSTIILPARQEDFCVELLSNYWLQACQ